jgi:hypothetical protein
MSNQMNKEQKADRDRRIINSRLAGASYQQIATTLGLSIGLAHKVVKAHLAETLLATRMDAEAIRQQEAARLDQLQAAVWSAAMKGQISASQQALRIMERRAKMLGLDTPNEEAADREAMNRVAGTAAAAAAATTAALATTGMTPQQAIEEYQRLAATPHGG